MQSIRERVTLASILRFHKAVLSLHNVHLSLTSTDLTTMSDAPSSAATRTFPAPCWVHDETLALIKAYSDRWLALGRGNLRASDWDAVASALTSSGATDGVFKTSIQCRHKIEKLRKRYRTEKQRALSNPGRFLSSWELFPVLDSLEIGVVGSAQSKKSGERADHKVNSANFGRNSNVQIERASMLPVAVNCNYRGSSRMESGGDRGFVPAGLAFGSRNHPDSDDSDDSDDDDDDDDNDNDDDDEYNDADADDGSMYRFPVKTLGARNVMPSVSRPVNYGKMNSGKNSYGRINHNYNVKTDVDQRCEFGKKFSGGWNLGPSPTQLRSKTSYKIDVNPSPGNGYRHSNGTTYSTGSGSAKGNGGSKRKKSAISEVVSSITQLGEVFMKMEKTKMETMKEIEKMRMEMEMKQTQMILEYWQQHLVNAFTETLVESTKEKKKVKTISTKGN